MSDTWDVKIIGIVGITAMAIVGLLTGHDGTLLAGAMAAVGAITGYKMGHTRASRGKRGK